MLDNQWIVDRVREMRARLVGNHDPSRAWYPLGEYELLWLLGVAENKAELRLLHEEIAALRAELAATPKAPVYVPPIYNPVYNYCPRCGTYFSGLHTCWVGPYVWS